MRGLQPANDINKSRSGINGTVRTAWHRQDSALNAKYANDHPVIQYMHRDNSVGYKHTQTQVDSASWNAQTINRQCFHTS